MKRQEITALHSKTIAELNSLVRSLSQELARVRLAQKARKSGNTHAQLIADDIARVRTVLRIKSLQHTTVTAEAAE